MTQVIDSFSGEYDWLSNFHPCDINYKGITFPSLENAYQAAKCKNREDMYGFVNITPGQSKRLGREVELRDDWDKIKFEIMESLLYTKFKSGTPLHRRLITTNDTTLIEGNTWGDTLWGVCNNQGENILGKMLMDIRDYYLTQLRDFVKSINL